MVDLGERLRRAVDPVEPIDLEEIRRGRATLRRRRPAPAIVAVAAAVCVALILVGIAFRHGHEGQSVQIVGSPDSRSPRASSATRDGVTVRVVLFTTTVTVGSDVTGQLTVDNRTGHNIAPPGGMLCADLAFEVLVFNGSHPAQGGFIQPGCRPGFAFEPGITTEAIKTRTTYFSGSTTRPLPAGAYSVGLDWDDMRLPVPPDLHVTIVQALSSRHTSDVAPRTIAPAVVRAANRTDVSPRFTRTCEWTLSTPPPELGSKGSAFYAPGV